MMAALLHSPTGRTQGGKGKNPAMTPTKGSTTSDSPGKKESPSELITQRIKDLGDWRAQTLAKVRRFIKEVDPEIVEEWKWRGVPVWEHNGMVCTGESYKDKIKLTFAKGAALKDPTHLFNSSLDGGVRRAIDISEGDRLDETAFKKLIKEAVALNVAPKKKR